MWQAVDTPERGIRVPRRSELPGLGEAAHCLQQLVALLRAATSASPDSSAPATQWDTWSSRISKARLSSAVVDGADLREDVDAVALLLDHPLDAAHLPLDAVQALDERVLVLRVAVVSRHVAPPRRTLRKRRSRSEFVTTKTLEKAIAAAATIGLSRPATASGIAATL